MRLEPKKVSVSGHQYLIGRLDVFDAANLSRLCAPILPILFHEVLSRIALAVLNSKDSDEATPEDRVEEIGQLISLCEPVLKRIADMRREDFDTVIRTALSCIERRQGKTWAKVMPDGVLAFDDIDTHELFTLVIHVLARELRPTIAALGLFAGAAQKSPEETSSSRSQTASTTS